MDLVTTRTGMFAARPEAWSQARRFIEAFCKAADVREDTCERGTRLIEALFRNTVQHGHGGGSDAPVWIALATNDRRVEITYEDHAPPFNPFALAHRDRGVGALLAQGDAASADYAYLFGRNRLRLTLA